MSGMSRRQFLGYGLGTGAALALPWTPGARAASAAAGGKLAKYQQALPLPGHGIVVAAPTSRSFRDKLILSVFALVSGCTGAGWAYYPRQRLGA